MEPPSKRPRLDYLGVDDEEEDQDELSMDPDQFNAIQDPMYQLDKKRAKAATRLKSAFEDIFEKYSKDFSGEDDVINFYTDEIEVDNGHVNSLKDKKKDGTTYGSDSSDEEERILSGKSGGRGDKSPSKPKSLILANRTKPTQTPPLQSQWNGFPGLGLYRLSSLPFASSPYGAPPPFEFAQSPYGSGHVDPVWRAPDLPPQLPHHQPRSLTGAWGSQLGSFGGQPPPAAKRLVTAKSFLLHAASISSKTDDDDIEKDDTPPNKPDSPRREVAQARTTKLSAAGVVSTQHHKPAESPQTQSPRAQKRQQSKKLDTRKSTILLDKESEREPRQLRPNERRIEIRIPMMKPLLPTEPRPTADETSLVISRLPPELEMEERLPFNKGPGDTLNPESTNSAHSSRDTNVQHMDQVDEDLEHASTLSQPRKIRRRRPRRTPKPTEFSSKDASPHDEQCLEHACVEATQELEPPQTAVDNVTADAVCISLHEIEQKSCLDNESDGIVSCLPPSTITNIDADGEPATHITSIEENEGESINGSLVDNHSPEEVSVQSLLLAKELSRCSVDGMVEMSDPTTMEADAPETAISHEPGATPYDNEVSPQDELDYPLANNRGEGTLSIYSHAPDKTTAHHPNPHLEDVFSSSQIPNTQDTQISPPTIGSQSPKYSAIRETVESELYIDQDHLPPVSEASQMYGDEEHDESDRPFLSSELVAEIDGLQLDSDYWDTQRTPTPEAPELPDEDLSIFPPSYDTHHTSELTSRRPSTSTKQTDTQHDVGTGRSPSPELGTPAGPEIIQRTASQTKNTPAPTTPTKSRGPRGTKPRSSHHHTPSSRRSTLSSFIPQDIDDESDDELSMAGSFSSAGSIFHSPFSRAHANESPSLPPLPSASRKRNRKSGLLTSSPSAARTTNNRIFGSGRDKIMSPATITDSRSQSRRGRPRAAHSSPLARTVAERLLSSPTKKHRATQAMSPGVVLSPHGTLRRCGEAEFTCERAFCLTCCK
ncbi:hypothetical protein F5B18DRAFT_639530 [Nemania serpens]|nr:hypothetical protein F5B18DRAFT_639530 [Nemania serpens]